MKTIVVLLNKRHFEDRSWFCYNKGEAEKLAKWLLENGVEAKAMANDEWDAAYAKWQSEQD